MTPSLRKRHLLIWLVLAILMPVLFVAAILVSPEPAYQEELYQEPADQAVNQEQPRKEPENER